MFLILLGDAGWAALLPSENFRGFFIGTEPTAAETETVLTCNKKANCRNLSGVSKIFCLVHLAFGDFSRPKDCRPLLHIYVVVNVVRIDRVDLIVRHVDDLRRVHLEHLVLPVVLQVSTLVKD